MMNMLFRTKKNKVIFTQLKNAVEIVGGEIVRLEYYPKFFGNIILHFKKGDKTYAYVVDRGEIYFNKNRVCNNFYVREEGKKHYQKLIEIIIATTN